MRVDADRRTGRLLGRLPRLTAYSWAELALLVLIAVQCARLFWILVAPVGPVGDWKATSATIMPQDASVLARFDPFFRLDGNVGPTTVTSLNLKLHGVREDRATGRGAAIIALPDGRQLNFAVGEEVMPGVTLIAVGFDNVTISRNGTAEQIFLDQSGPAQAVGAPQTVAPPATGPAMPMPVVVAPTPTPAPVAPGQAINFVPRTSNGRVTGIVVSPGSDGGRAFGAAGFVPGDVVVAINGQRVSSLEQVRAAMGQSEVNVMVDRGGMAVPLHVRLNR